MNTRCGCWQSAILLLMSVPCSVAKAQQLDWVSQWGTAYEDRSLGVSADPSGNVYITGYTNEGPGSNGAGIYKAFLNKFDSSGNLQWSRQAGSSGPYISYGVATDAFGNAYITGDGSNNDAFVSKYDPSGNLLWTSNVGTIEVDTGRGVSLDVAGNIYISGYTRGDFAGGPSVIYADSFVAKLNGAGSLQWVRQLGSTLTFEDSGGVSTDTFGNVYVTGYASGNLGGPNAGDVGYDAFVSKLSASGDVQWIRQFGTRENDFGAAVSTDSLGNLYVAAYTPGAKQLDAYVRKYDAGGNLLWTRYMGTAESEWSLGVSADSAGNAYVTGFTYGSMDGTSAGNSDAFVIKYDSSGNVVWTRQLGTSSYDFSQAAYADSRGNIYISGYTGGSFGGPNAGSADAFVAKFSTVPEPGTLTLGVLTAGFFMPLRLSRTRA